MALKRHYEEVKGSFFWEGGLSFAHFTLLNGAFLVGFALSLGASDLVVGVLAGIPLFANVLQLFSAFMLEATGSRKKTAIVSLILGRILWVPVVFIAFGAFSYSPLLMFTLVLVASSLLSALGNLSMLSWMKDIVPMKKLPRFWGRRNIFASIAGIVSYLLGSLVIDLFPGSRPYGIVFLAAVFLGLAAVAIVIRLPEQKRRIKAISFETFRQSISVPLKDAGFRPLLKFGIYWGFALGFLSPFYILFMLRDLSMSFTAISVLLTVDLVGRVAGLNFWGSAMEKWGSKPVLIICVTVNILNPLLFVLIPANMLFFNYFLIAAVWILTSVAYAGLDIAVYRAVFKAAPRRHDAYYLSVFSAFTGLMSAVGPMAGGLAAWLLSGLMPSWFSSLRALFAVGFVLRAFAVVLATRIDEPRARGVNDVLRRMKTVRFFSFFPGIYNVAYLASRLVLFPTKQLFFIQRKATERMREDVAHALENMAKAAALMERFRAENAAYYRRRLLELKKALKANVESLSYQRGTWYEELPRATLEKVRQFEESMKGPVTVADSKKIHRQIERLRKKLEGAFARNIR